MKRRAGFSRSTAIILHPGTIFTADPRYWALNKCSKVEKCVSAQMATIQKQVVDAFGVYLGGGVGKG